MSLFRARRTRGAHVGEKPAPKRSRSESLALTILSCVWVVTGHRKSPQKIDGANSRYSISAFSALRARFPRFGAVPLLRTSAAFLPAPRCCSTVEAPPRAFPSTTPPPTDESYTTPVTYLTHGGEAAVAPPPSPPYIAWKSASPEASNLSIPRPRSWPGCLAEGDSVHCPVGAIRGVPRGRTMLGEDGRTGRLDRLASCWSHRPSRSSIAG